MTVSLNLLFALIAIESGGNDRAYNKAEDAVGCLQIRQGVVTDVNRILNRQSTAFRLKDCYDRGTAILICRTYLDHYVTSERLGREPTLEDYARCWNEGPSWFKKPVPSDYAARALACCEG